jgi:dihydroorotate dehydrogenase (fumarate)
MVDLTTSYLGLSLKNPLVASASPLSQHLDVVRKLEEAGVSAVVMYSLFEEQIIADSLRLHRDLTRYRDLRRSVTTCPTWPVATNTAADWAGGLR